MIKTMTCKSCRNECELKVKIENGIVTEVTENGCRRGIIFVQKAMANNPDLFKGKE